MGFRGLDGLEATSRWVRVTAQLPGSGFDVMDYGHVLGILFGFGHSSGQQGKGIERSLEEKKRHIGLGDEGGIRDPHPSPDVA
ncbi:hypothetical protein ACE6H2_025685 [Prunus campanulata]